MENSSHMQSGEARRRVRPQISDEINSSASPDEKAPPSKTHSSHFVVAILVLIVLGIFVAPYFLNNFFKEQHQLDSAPTEVVKSYNQLTTPAPRPSKSASERKMALTELRHEVVTEGTGSATIQKGQEVTVHATGSVINPDGTLKKFWSTEDPGQKPFTWKAGIGQVIAGWDNGVLGMKQGEIRKIFIPSAMGYGANGFPAWGIPANADLHFEIECLNMK